MLTLPYSLVALMSMCSVGSLCAASPAKQPHIIFVLVDDMGWGDLQHYHQKHALDGPVIDTPVLDRLAMRGVQLTRHYSAAPVSAPARASLFTGMHQGQAPVVRNSNFDAPIEDEPTIASVLRSAGYRTALIGKWGLAGGPQMGGSPSSSPAWPTKRGFDFFFGYANHRMGHRHYPHEEPHQDPENGCNAIWEAGEIITPKLAGCYSTDLYTARAKKWITDTLKESRDRPFFLALCLTAPHARLAIPAMPYPSGGGLRGGVQWLGKSGQMINTASVATWDSYLYPRYRREKWPLAAKRHATMITRVDEAMGDLVTLLEDLGIEQDTYIVFTSDNGAHDEYGALRMMNPMLPSLAQDPSFFRSYGLSDGIKRDVFDGGINVPCIVYAPLRIPAGHECSHPTQFHDWMATLADLAGVSTPARSAGRSLRLLLEGKAEQIEDNVVYTEFNYPGQMTRFRHYAGNKAGRVRGEQQAFYFRDAEGRVLKALRTGVNADESNKDFEVYDTLSDPQESLNLAPTLGAGLQSQLRAYYLRQRIPYRYVQQKLPGESEYHYTGARPYDGESIPALRLSRTLVAGYQLRELILDEPLPWVPRFDSHPQSRQVEPQLCDGEAEVKLPAGSLTEIRGYLDIPRTGIYHLSTTMAAGGRSHIQLHGISVTGGDALLLDKGPHRIVITLLQSASVAGGAQLLWQPEGEASPTALPPELLLREGD